MQENERTALEECIDFNNKNANAYAEASYAPLKNKTTYSVDEVAEILNICRSSAYKIAKSGQFQYIKAGRIIRISKPSFDKWLNGE